MTRTRKSFAAISLLLAGFLLTGCTIPTVHREDVVGLWKHPTDTRQTVEFHNDGTAVVHNIPRGMLRQKTPDPSAPPQLTGTWSLEQHASGRGYYALLFGLTDDGRGFMYSFEIVGAGSNTSLYLPLHGRYEGQRYEFKR